MILLQSGDKGPAPKGPEVPQGQERPGGRLGLPTPLRAPARLRLVSPALRCCPCSVAPSTFLHCVVSCVDNEGRHSPGTQTVTGGGVFLRVEGEEGQRAGMLASLALLPQAPSTLSHEGDQELPRAGLKVPPSVWAGEDPEARLLGIQVVEGLWSVGPQPSSPHLSSLKRPEPSSPTAAPRPVRYTFLLSHLFSGDLSLVPAHCCPGRTLSLIMGLILEAPTMFLEPRLRPGPGLALGIGSRRGCFKG